MKLSFSTRSKGIGFWLEHAAVKAPDNVCLSLPTGDYSFSQVLLDVTKLASYLESQGLESGQFVAVEGGRYLQIVSALAIGSLGSASATLPADVDSRAFIRNHFQFLISESESSSIASMKTISVHMDALQPEALQRRPLSEKPNLDLPYRVFFTSGSSGTPRAVPISHRKLISRMEVATVQLGRRQSLSLFPLDSLLGFHRVLESLRSGLPYLSVGDLDFTVNQIERWGVRAIALSPVSLRRFLEDCKQKRFRSSQLDLLLTTGAALDQHLELQAREYFDCDVRTMYGSTEAGHIAVSKGPRLNVEDQGPVIKGVNLEIVDEADNELPVGRVGAVRVKGPASVTEYLFNPEATKKSFRDGFFYPGDQGRILRNGRLEIVGRLDDVVNLEGVKVSFAEIERYCQQILGLSEVCAFSWNSNEKGIQLGLGLVSGNNLDSESILSTLKMGFGSIAPSLLLELESLPLSPNGKPDRQELKRTAEMAASTNGKN